MRRGADRPTSSVSSYWHATGALMEPSPSRRTHRLAPQPSFIAVKYREELPDVDVLHNAVQAMGSAALPPRFLTPDLNLSSEAPISEAAVRIPP